MNKYNEVHHQLGTEDGKRAWIGPKVVGQKKLEEKTADDLNAQFENSGIKYELASEEDQDKPDGAQIGLNTLSAVFGTSVAIEAAKWPFDSEITHQLTKEEIDSNPELFEGMNPGEFVHLVVDMKSKTGIPKAQWPFGEEIEHEITAEDLENNPELITEGLTIGMVVTCFITE